MKDGTDNLFPLSALRNITANSSVTDMNSLTDMGIYFCDSITSNRPVATSYWWVVVISDGGYLCRQLVFAANSQYMYTRYRNSSGTWQSWNAIVG